jgi:hypothetical protein
MKMFAAILIGSITVDVFYPPPPAPPHPPTITKHDTILIASRTRRKGDAKSKLKQFILMISGKRERKSRERGFDGFAITIVMRHTQLRLAQTEERKTVMRSWENFYRN